MFGVASEGDGTASSAARVAEVVHHAPVVTSGDQGLRFVPVNGVDVGAISAGGEDSLNGPAVLGVVGLPLGALGVGGSGGILLHLINVVEEELVSTANGTDKLAISAPVEGDNEGLVGVESALEGPVGDGVDADVVVVRTNSAQGLVGGELDGLDPLGGVVVGVDNVVKTILAHGKGTVVVADSQEAGVGPSNSAGALRGGHVGEGRSATLDVSSLVADGAALNALPLLDVPDLDLVVITGGNDVVTASAVETPDLTFVVRLHDLVLLGAIRGALEDVTGAAAHDKVAVVHIDSADEAAKVDGALSGAISAVGNDNVAVLATGDELAALPADGADEATLVGVPAFLELSATLLPNVDLRVAAAGVGAVLVVHGNAGVRGGVTLASVDALVARLGTGVPELDVLGATSDEALGARLGGVAHIHDLVGVSLLPHDEAAVGDVEDVHVVVVVEIDESAVVTVLGDADGSHTARALGELIAGLLLTGAGIPCEGNGGRANLAGSGELSARRDGNCGNVVVVGVLVGGSLLGLVLGHAAAEEFLGVGALVKDNAKGSGHVDGLSIGVEENVLTAIGATVTVNVFEVVALRGLLAVHGGMVIRLHNCSFVGAHGHELFTLTGFHDFEHVGLGHLAALTHLGGAGLLVVDSSLVVSFTGEFRIVTGVLSGSAGTTTHVFDV